MLDIAIDHRGPSTGCSHTRHQTDKMVQVCIDLGAAPGAWTEVLAEVTEDLVIAVDPAALSDSCLARPNVRHVQGNSWNADTGALLARLALCTLVRHRD